MLKALQNFLSTEWNRASARKRGGGLQPLSLDDLDAESRFLADSSGEAPEIEFDRNWAMAVIEHALQKLERELESAGKAGLFQQLRPHLQGDRNGRPYGEIAAGLGITEGALKVKVHRMRQRYGELLRAEVARTVGEDDEVLEELRHLIQVVSR